MTLQEITQKAIPAIQKMINANSVEILSEDVSDNITYSVVPGGIQIVKEDIVVQQLLDYHANKRNKPTQMDSAKAQMKQEQMIADGTYLALPPDKQKKLVQGLSKSNSLGTIHI